ncbi:MAG TPA: hypothetical protein VFE46_02885 [Pirellulales bacterium]|jgi:type I restriction enzyme S subunit|nr:hypothetical protein [Pirellulales bacterium]
MNTADRALPPKWAEVTLHDVLLGHANGKVLQHGWSPQCEKWPSGSPEDWGVLKTTAVQAGAFLEEHNKLLPKKLHPRAHLEVRPGDMLITCAGPRVRCGVPALVRNTRPRLILSGKMYRFRGNPELIDPRYLEALLLSPESQAAIDGMKTGISDSGLNLTHDRFVRLRVILAPLAEQTRIADRIEELFSDLSAGVAALEQVQRKLKRYRSAVLHAAVTGRLTAAWRKQHGPPPEPGNKLLARILVERRLNWETQTLAQYRKERRQPPKNWRDRYQMPVEPKPNDLPELPDGWCWATVDQLLIEGLSSGISVKGQDTPPGVAALKLNALTDNGFDYTAIRYIPIDRRTAEANAIREGDFYVSRGNGSLRLLGRGTVAQRPPRQIVFPDTMIRFRLSPSAAYLPTFWPSPLVRRQIEKKAKTTAGIHKVSQADLESIVVPLPPIEEQAEEIAMIQEKLSQIDAMEAEVKRGLARAMRLRQSILKSAFAGKLVPRDPKDESAKELLERVRCALKGRPTKSDDLPKRSKNAKKQRIA